MRRPIVSIILATLVVALLPQQSGADSVCADADRLLTERSEMYVANFERAQKLSRSGIRIGDLALSRYFALGLGVQKDEAKASTYLQKYEENLWEDIDPNIVPYTMWQWELDAAVKLQMEAHEICGGTIFPPHGSLGRILLKDAIQRFRLAVEIRWLCQEDNRLLTNYWRMNGPRDISVECESQTRIQDREYNNFVRGINDMNRWYSNQPADKAPE